MEGAGFEPAKAEPSDLQSDPFGHSGTPPKHQHTSCVLVKTGADERSRTPDRLITSQLLYQLSYVSITLFHRRRIIRKLGCRCKHFAKTF